MRQVLQNGMSFANERFNLRYLYASAIIFAQKKSALILSVSLKLFWEIFLCQILRINR